MRNLYQPFHDLARSLVQKGQDMQNEKAAAVVFDKRMEGDHVTGEVLARPVIPELPIVGPIMGPNFLQEYEDMIDVIERNPDATK